MKTKSAPLDKNDPLVNALAEWRERQLDAARPRLTKLYHVLGNDAITEIAATRPETEADLQEIKGMGETRVKKYGADILRLVADHGGTSGRTREPAAIEKIGAATTKKVQPPKVWTEEELAKRLESLDRWMAERKAAEQAEGRHFKAGEWRSWEDAKAERLHVEAAMVTGLEQQMVRVRRVLATTWGRELSRLNIRREANVTDKAIDQLEKDGHIERVPEDRHETRTDDMLYQLVRAPATRPRSTRARG